MRSFNERDVRRHYDLLQHRPELGLTQLKALDGEDIIGIGLFDNEEDFVSESRRYNGLGDLYVGVNPRSLRLLDEYGGLKNRMRTLFMDVVEKKDIDYVTGVAVPGRERLSGAAQKYRCDASVLFDGEVLFPMNEPIRTSQGGREEVRQKIAFWSYGEIHAETAVPDAVCAGDRDSGSGGVVVSQADPVPEVPPLYLRWDCFGDYGGRDGWGTTDEHRLTRIEAEGRLVDAGAGLKPAPTFFLPRVAVMVALPSLYASTTPSGVTEAMDGWLLSHVNLRQDLIAKRNLSPRLRM